MKLVRVALAVLELLGAVLAWSSPYDKMNSRITASKNRSSLSSKQLRKAVTNGDEDGASSTTLFPSYGLAGVDLSEKWLNLVKEGKVSAKVSMDGGGSSIHVRYGVRIAQRRDDDKSNHVVEHCEEFVEQIVDDKADAVVNPRIDTINRTLAETQSLEKNGEKSAGGVKYSRDGPFVAQLQLVRTLRPPASPGFGSTTSKTTTSVPPEYDASLDSFVTGPLRLSLRPRTDILDTPDLCTPWDVYHNISPADSRGHFLLVPTVDDQSSNWRGQSLVKQDCHDLVHLAATVAPVGSLLMSYNSVGAGASQNHVHCHAWPCPPIPLLKSGDGGWNCYAASKTTDLFASFQCSGGTIQTSFLDYPCCCIKLSSTTVEPKVLSLLGEALYETITVVGSAPHNIGILNRPFAVDVYVFVRQAERSANVVPALKLGASEMMGVFHAQSDDEMEQLLQKNAEPMMAQALKDVSYEPRWEMWSEIKNALEYEE